MSPKRQISLNADMGESFGAYTMGDDAALLDVVTCANLACGFHGGDPLVMQNTLRAAKDRNIGLGAHPAYPDLQGFGRRKMSLSTEEVEAILSYQVSALYGMAQREGLRLQHVKPHGALYNMAAVDQELAEVIAATVKSIDPDLILLAAAGSKMITAAEQYGCKVAAEVFADRTYMDDGTLTPRTEVGAVLHDPAQAAAQILSFLKADGIVTPSGKVIKTPLHSICVHGDSPGAVDMARHLRSQLLEAGIGLAPLSEVI